MTLDLKRAAFRRQVLAILDRLEGGGLHQTDALDMIVEAAQAWVAEASRNRSLEEAENSGDGTYRP